MSGAARASRPWILLGTSLAVGGAGYLLYYGPGTKLQIEVKKPPSPLTAPDALDPNAFRPFKLADIKQYNHNTNIFKFAFDDPRAKYNGKTASCVVFKADIDGKEIIRPYTPTSRPNTIGELEFVIKKYPKGVMSKYVHEMKPGDTIQIKGPSKYLNFMKIFLITYLLISVPKYPYEANKFQNIVLLAGGTGITPMVR